MLKKVGFSDLFAYICSMRQILIIIFTLLPLCCSMAQQTIDDVYEYKIDDERLVEECVSSDTLLFYRAMHNHNDIYGQITDYRFSFVDYARRGAEFFQRDVVLDGLTLSRSRLSALRRLGLAESNYAGVSGQSAVVGSYAGVDEFSTYDGVPIDGGNAGLFFSGRGYLGGVRAAVHHSMNRGWSMSLYASGRMGNDLYVDGVYQDALDAALRLSKEFTSGGVLSMVAMLQAGERGLHYGSTDEAFTLTRNNLYNPSWGYQAGDKRNSRTRSDNAPFVMFSYVTDVGARTRMTLAAGGSFEGRGYSSLGWYGASSPRPDNYRYMPSYYANPAVADAVADEWRKGNAKYTQIDWDELYNRNRNSTRGAIYALEDRVEQRLRGEVTLRFRSEITSSLSLHYALRASVQSSRNFKRMRDLLGATYLTDIDYYLIDDDTFSHKTDNDMRHPDRHIAEGYRFGYDYALAENNLAAEFGVRYAFGGWSASADVSVGHNRLYRDGHFEKELYEGAGSLGRSADVKLSPYALRATLSYAIAPKHHFELGVLHAAVAPECENLFLNPQYNNRLADNITLQHHSSAELNYRFSGEKLECSFAAFATAVANERELFRAYDDLSATYCDVDVEGLATLRYGVEAAARVKLSRHLSADASLAVGRYTYTNNPTVTHYADVDNAIISTSRSYMRGCRVGGAPQVTSTIGLEYMTYRGWAVSCGAQIAALRYVDASVIRRTERVARQASVSEEIYRSFIAQRRLNDAFTLDASVSRWFNIGAHRLSLTLSVRNLLGRDDIVYGGYESSRIRHYTSGANHVYMPQDDILTYAYPRTYYGVISWKF